MQKLKKIIN
jgi:hypothetical protein